MHVPKSFVHRCLSLSLLCLGGISLMPLASLAVEWPGQSESLDAPPRTASGAPKRCPHPCVTFSSDFDGDGQLELPTPMTVLSPTNNMSTTHDGVLRLMLYLPRLQGAFGSLYVEEILSSESERPNRGFRYRTVYEADVLPLPEEIAAGPRIVTLEIDDLQLEPGAIYLWSFGFTCGEASEGMGDWASPFTTVEGHITYPETDSGVALPNDMVALNPQDRASLAQDFADRQLWSETLHLTASLRTENPQAWAALLESQGLGCFSQVPFAGENANFTIADDPRCFVE